MAKEKKAIYCGPMVENLASKYGALGPEFDPQDTHTWTAIVLQSGVRLISPQS